MLISHVQTIGMLVTLESVDAPHDGEGQTHMLWQPSQQ